MITSTQLYWLTRLDAICTSIGVFTVLTALLSIALVIAGCVLRCAVKEYSWQDDNRIKAERETGRRLHGYAKRVVFVFCALSCIGTLIPSTKEMAAILVIPQIANSEKVQEVGGKIYDLAVEWMDALRPHKPKGEK